MYCWVLFRSTVTKSRSFIFAPEGTVRVHDDAFESGGWSLDVCSIASACYFHPTVALHLCTLSLFVPDCARLGEQGDELQVAGWAVDPVIEDEHDVYVSCVAVVELSPLLHVVHSSCFLLITTCQVVCATPLH